MTAQVGADFARLSTTHQHLISTVAKTNSALNDLKNYLAPMVATWEGEAATRYQVLQRNWDTSAAELNATLQRIGVALGQTHDDFQSTEKANAARF